VIELDLMTAAQRAELPRNEDITAADRLIVASPTTTGLIMIRALAPEMGWIPAARNALAACTVPPAVTGRAFREMNALYFETTARRCGIAPALARPPRRNPAAASPERFPRCAIAAT